MAIKTTVLIICKNEVNNLPILFACLEKQTLLPSEVVVVDDYSRDGTWEWLISNHRSFPFAVRTVQAETNRSQARNLGMHMAHYDLVAFTDAGCEPKPQWLAELMNAYTAAKSDVVVAGVTVGVPATEFESACVPYVLVMPDRLNSQTYLPATRSMLVSKKNWTLAKGFNERLNEAEDFSFAQQLRLAQVPIVVAEKAVVKWRPRKTYLSFLRMIFLYAKGDGQSRYLRPKVVLLIVRYVLAAILLLVNTPLTLVILFTGFIGYVLWSIQKNYRYTPGGWYWLPLLQLGSDVMVIAGTATGLLFVK